jgi:hypothetical protein
MLLVEVVEFWPNELRKHVNNGTIESTTLREQERQQRERERECVCVCVSVFVCACVVMRQAVPASAASGASGTPRNASIGAA